MARHRVPRLLLAGLGQQREEEDIPDHPIDYNYKDTEGLKVEIEGTNA
jgi:hypothetical protein